MPSRNRNALSLSFRFPASAASVGWCGGWCFAPHFAAVCSSFFFGNNSGREMKRGEAPVQYRRAERSALRGPIAAHARSAPEFEHLSHSKGLKVRRTVSQQSPNNCRTLERQPALRTVNRLVTPNSRSSCSVAPDSTMEEQSERVQEAKNSPNIPLQEKFHRGILRGLINISDTP